eukprot:36508-Hanusia_phi.AAC.1
MIGGKTQTVSAAEPDGAVGLAPQSSGSRTIVEWVTRPVHTNLRLAAQMQADSAAKLSGSVLLTVL